MRWDSPRSWSTKLGQRGPSLRSHGTNGRHTYGSSKQSASTPRRWSFGDSFSGLARRDQVPMRSPPQLPSDGSRPMARAVDRPTPRQRRSPASRITAGATRNTHRSASPGASCCQMVSSSSSVGHRRRWAVAALRQRRRHLSPHLPIAEVLSIVDTQVVGILEALGEFEQDPGFAAAAREIDGACPAMTAWTPTSCVRR